MSSRSVLTAAGLAALLAASPAEAAPRGDDAPVAASKDDGRKGGSRKGGSSSSSSSSKGSSSSSSSSSKGSSSSSSSSSSSRPSSSQPATQSGAPARSQPRSQLPQPEQPPAQPSPQFERAVPQPPGQTWSSQKSATERSGGGNVEYNSKPPSSTVAPSASTSSAASGASARPSTTAPTSAATTAVRPSGATYANPRQLDGSRAVAARSPASRTVHGAAPTHFHRPYAGRPARPTYRTYYGRDHRYARPHYNYVRPHPAARRPAPVYYHYRPYYTHWYVHPYYRHTHATWVVVRFDFAVSPWVYTWTPPARAGWRWIPGHTDRFGRWVPGHWAPVASAPVRYSRSYTYVPGWWIGDVYVEGHYRVDRRDGWVWVDGAYVDEDVYRRGHWQPSDNGPDGYEWEPGFFDGEVWIEGFWRPEYRDGFRWVDGYFDGEGVYNAGYWQPVGERAGSTWVPGWFDGNQWVEGYWVSDDEYRSADPQSWEPEEGWDDGWDEADQGLAQAKADDEDAPLALPVDIDD